VTAFVKIICLAATITSPQVDKAIERCVTAAVGPDARVAPKPQIAPGPPPLLSFRYYEGKLHHRNNDSDLMLDDAGH
jgi:hypothetical protein